MAAFAMLHVYRPGRGITMQRHRVNLSIASPSEIERTARQLRVIREDFLSTGSLALWSPRPLIFDSWQRCRLLHVNPSRRCAPLAVARETQLAQLREANALLIRAARPVVKQLMSEDGQVRHQRCSRVPVSPAVLVSYRTAPGETPGAAGRFNRGFSFDDA